MFGPRKVPHTFAKVGEGEARLLMLSQPAAKIEHFFKAVSEGIEKNMWDAEKLQFKEEHGIKVVGPSIDYLTQ